MKELYFCIILFFPNQGVKIFRQKVHTLFSEYIISKTLKFRNSLSIKNVSYLKHQYYSFKQFHDIANEFVDAGIKNKRAYALLLSGLFIRTEPHHKDR